MKNKRYTIKNLLFVVLLLISTSSCNDWLTLQPKDETILEDYWASGSDVEAAVMGCYTAMMSSAVMTRIVLWGELRGDNVATSASNSSLAQRLVNQQNISPSNTYAYWGDIYNVINQCNTVLFYAPGVVGKDANFDKGTLHAYESEALTLRALMYFYLVRTFRDIPYVTTPSIDDNQNFYVAKSPRDTILKNIISDLVTAKSYALERWNSAASDPGNKGRITKQAVRAILADVYLWANDYENCITISNEFLQVNDALDEEVRLKLIDADYMLKEVFYTRNSAESIFELQFSSDYTNSSLASLYGGYLNTKGALTGPNVANVWEFKQGAANSPYGTTDQRALDFLRPESDNYAIYKYVGTTRSGTSTDAGTYNGYRTNTPNWIFYRLPDIYLSLAEALVERNNREDMSVAMRYINKTYLRANPQLGNDSLMISNYPDQGAMRKLVLNERRREFVFEGKRWFDLVRAAERTQSTSDIISCISRALSTDASILSIAKNKLSFMDALYFPIYSDELKQNPKLVQNPFYLTNSTTSTTN